MCWPVSRRIISQPLYSGMTVQDVEDVAGAVCQTSEHC